MRYIITQQFAKTYCCNCGFTDKWRLFSPQEISAVIIHFPKIVSIKNSKF